MADHGHLLFGTFLTPAAVQPAEVVALARLTEQVGLDLVMVQDHPYQAKYLDTWDAAVGDRRPHGDAAGGAERGEPAPAAARRARAQRGVPGSAQRRPCRARARCGGVLGRDRSERRRPADPGGEHAGPRRGDRGHPRHVGGGRRERAGRRSPPPRVGCPPLAAERGAVSGTVLPGAAGGSAQVPTARPVATRAGTSPSTGPGVARSALQTVPTPDDGTRRSDVRVWDESARPTAPAPDPGRIYTVHEQATGRHLVAVHDNLRAELQQLHDLLDQVTAGTMDAGAARDHVNAMTMRQNNWTLGAYCESYCRIVTVHHTIEDQSMFRHLRRADHRLRPVIDRLRSTGSSTTFSTASTGPWSPSSAGRTR
jgi:Hemerythrin HHE cation binding domain